MAKQLLFHVLVILSLVLCCSASLYIVGDSAGWDISTDLDTWSKGKKFVVGDILLFQYSSSYSVSEVTRESYRACSTTNVIQSSSNGNTSFTLSRPGDEYFICGNKLYCLGGMKLHAHVEQSAQLASKNATATATAAAAAAAPVQA
ncbi:hypothetical protein F0562_026445 [Nyssa sinensis]|uniref:Phytocyanin domain-containing protein n=1 Tax=Nyssa sinensis TaxID=561372 RepID=A0A5J5B984_9ASTE|nr:hypothetical protein F0562_026445 [Nyssa sinensis]